MQIKGLLNQHRSDFTATMACEHCGHESKVTTGYNDAFYHDRVIPAMYCGACGKNRAGQAKPKE